MSSGDIISKRARVEEEEGAEEMESEEEEEFLPLHENMFEDIVMRETSETEASIGDILTGPAKISYLRYCRNQIGQSVPAHIVSEHLVPFLGEQAVPVGVSVAEFFVGLDSETGKLAVMTGVSGVGPTEKLPSWPRVDFDFEKRDVLECGGVYDGFCRFQEGQSDEYMERQVWSFVFDCAFKCAQVL